MKNIASVIIIVFFSFSGLSYSNSCDSCFYFINHEDYTSALKCYEKAIKKNEKFDACLFYGRAYSNYGLNNLENAKKDVLVMISNFELNEPKMGIANTYFLLSRINSKEKLYNQEIQNLFKALEATEKVDILVTMSFAMNRVGRFKEGAEFATKAISLNPNYAFAYSNRGYSHLMMNKLVEAEKDLDKAFSLSQNNPYLFKYKGLLNIKQNDYKKACENFSKAMQFEDKYFDNVYDKEDILKLNKENCK